MNPLVTTVNALRELASGLSPSAIYTSTVLFHYEAPGADYLLASIDTPVSQRVILVRESNTTEKFVPEHLALHREAVIGRMVSFAERSKNHPISLPKPWHQYKHKNLIAFFAVPTGDADSSRWIAEIQANKNEDVIFWETTTSRSKSALEVFGALERRLQFDLDKEWSSALTASSDHFTETRRPDLDGTDIGLSALAPSVTKGWSLEQWFDALSTDQTAFLEAPTTRSIRLRGPAGSGKTVALTLKAIREVEAASKNISDPPIRVLVVTHSWSLAAQIDHIIASLAVTDTSAIDVFPLLEIAQSFSPNHAGHQKQFSVIGDDSYSGKQAQLGEIEDLLSDFCGGDWITYRGSVSEQLRERLDSGSIQDRRALAWDLLIEFGSVIGAAAIFPGAGSESRYFQLQRMSWMLPLTDRSDRRVIFALYCRYMERLETRRLMTADQVLSDFLNHLETHAWNWSRKENGYDLIFADEFHLFSPLERQVLHYLTRDSSSYPRIFMAVDPRQSPSEAFIGVAAASTMSLSPTGDDDLGDITNLELSTVHRFTPQILDLVKHIHHEFPTLELGKEWDIDFADVESSQAPGDLPSLIVSASPEGEEVDLYRAVQETYSKGRIAIAIVDTREWSRFSELASRIGSSPKYHVATITGRSDIDGLGYRRRGVVVGPAEFLAGLQFDTVLVAGISNNYFTSTGANSRFRFLSLLYLALSRAEREIRIFVNEEDGGVPDVLLRAVKNRLTTRVVGSAT